jgi:hypothetical protein
MEPDDAIERHSGCGPEHTNGHLIMQPCVAFAPI